MNLRATRSGIRQRIAFVVVVALITWCGIGRADATVQSVDQGAAYSLCMAAVERNEAFRDSNGFKPVKDSRCPLTYDSSFGIYNCRTTTLWSNGSVNNANTHCVAGGETNFTWPIKKTCAARPHVTTEFAPPSGSQQCIDGCEYTHPDNGDGTSTAVPNGNVCTPPVFDPSKNNQCDMVTGSVRIGNHATQLGGKDAS